MALTNQSQRLGKPLQNQALIKQVSVSQMNEYDLNCNLFLYRQQVNPTRRLSEQPGNDPDVVLHASESPAYPEHESQ